MYQAVCRSNRVKSARKAAGLFGRGIGCSDSNAKPLPRRIVKWPEDSMRFSDLAMDMRFALRQLRRAPGFAAIVVARHGMGAPRSAERGLHTDSIEEVAAHRHAERALRRLIGLRRHADDGQPVGEERREAAR